MPRTLTAPQRQILVDIVQRRAPEGASSLAQAIDRDELTGEEIDALLDLVTEELAEQGFDNDYRPTPYGADLEALITSSTSVSSRPPPAPSGSGAIPEHSRK